MPELREFPKSNDFSPVGVYVLREEFDNAHLLGAHVVVLVTTHSFTSEVERYAAKISDEHLQQIVLVDGAALEDYQQRGSAAIQESLAMQASNSLEKLIQAQSKLLGKSHVR